MTAHAAEPDNELFRAALEYRAQGRPVFPVCAVEPHEHHVGNRRMACEDKNRGKTPLVAWKDFQSRLPSEREVRRWWQRWPTANIGMATGQLSGIVVGDLDGELAQLKAEQYGYEAGPYVLTGRQGGRHLFFAWRIDAPHNFAKRNGIDFRGDGGYVVLPPSRHILGAHYRWGVPLTGTSALPPLPEWFDVLAGHIERPTLPRFSLAETIADHERNDTLFRLASAMRGNGLDEDAIYAALTATNVTRCQPPLDDAEVYKIAHNVSTRYERGAPPYQVQTTRHRQPDKVDLSRVSIIDVVDIQPEEVDWAWDKRLALGTFAVLQGDPGLGKSLILTEVAARISTGRALPGEPPGTVHEPRNVVMLVNEDDLARTIRPRLDRAGADVTRIAVIKGQYDNEGVLMPLDLSHREQLRHAFAVKQAVMLIIDPLFGHLPAGLSISKEEEIRHLLAPLVAIIGELDAVMVGVRHLNQSIDLPSQYRGLGSGAWTAQARSELSVMRDPTNDVGKERYVLGRSKGNLGKAPPVLTYTIESESDDGIPYIVWGTPSLMTWEELIREAVSAKKSDSAVGKAQGAVLKAITDAGADGITWAEVVDIVGVEGHSAHTAERARKELSLQIVNRKLRVENGQMQTRWYTLEQFAATTSPPTPPTGGHYSFLGEVGEVGEVETPKQAEQLRQESQLNQQKSNDPPVGEVRGGVDVWDAEEGELL